MTVLSLAAAEVNVAAVVFDEALCNPKSCACCVAKHEAEDAPNFRKLIYTNNHLCKRFAKFLHNL
jgi:hypothetical protein